MVSASSLSSSPPSCSLDNDNVTILSDSINCQPIDTNQLDFLSFTSPTPSEEGVCWKICNVFRLRDSHSKDSMIHITVPDTQILVQKEDGVSKYTAFNLHVNGWFHAAVRYSSLHQLAESIKQRFPNKYRGPEFPPRRLFKLDERGTEDRRERIAKYLNAVVQTVEIIRSPFVEKRFLDFQLDSYRTTSTNVSLDVYLGDGMKINIKCNVHDNTAEVMKLVGIQLGMTEGEYSSSFNRFLLYFGLFMARPRDGICIGEVDTSDMLVVRLMRNFEAPYVSLQQVNMKSAAQGIYYRLVLRKLMWDPRTEECLLDDSIFVDLLYRQAKEDLKNGCFNVSKEESKYRLKAFEKTGDQLQYLRTCHLQPSYSYIILLPCRRDDESQGNMECGLKIGRRQIVLTMGDGESVEHRVYRATRIRIWRISQSEKKGDPLIFQFEYLIAKDTFEWVTLHTDQAILISLMLQSIGLEILTEHNNVSIDDQLRSQHDTDSLAALERNRQNRLVHNRRSNPIETTKVYPEPARRPSIASCAPSENGTSNTHDDRINDTIRGNDVSERDPLGVAGIYESFNDVFTTITDVLPVHNDAFSNITDDDL